MQKTFFKTFKNKTIIVTGHTGFKGSWLTLWLYSIGAKVIGISKNIHGEPSHFKELKLKNVKNYFLDIKNLKKVKNIFKKHQPDYVFHLAGQSMVKKSYGEPVETFITNSIGTLNVLDSLKSLKKKCKAVLITSDKVYKNFEISRGYREDDELGGKDPYSSSKAVAELIIHSYFSSFIGKNGNIKIAVARAGNVIGGGDWNKNRLIPDCVRAWSKNKKLIIRNPRSTRPWQNVLDVVRGYMILATKLNSSRRVNGEVFNFGPNQNKNFSVIQVVKFSKVFWKNVNWSIKNRSDSKFFESRLLKLNSQKSRKLLGWKCKLNLRQSLNFTINWYKSYYKSKRKNVYDISINSLKKYQKLIL